MLNKKELLQEDSDVAKFGSESRTTSKRLSLQTSHMLTTATRLELHLSVFLTDTTSDHKLQIVYIFINISL